MEVEVPQGSDSGSSPLYTQTEGGEKSQHQHQHLKVLLSSDDIYSPIVYLSYLLYKEAFRTRLLKVGAVAP